MGTDNLHHKQKQRSLKSYRRKAGRKSYDRVLIVCEGSKTEPYYLRGLCRELDLSAENIKIEYCKTANDPKSIVDDALEKFSKEKSYDRVYCVFDKDVHPTYQAALDKMKVHSTRVRKPAPITAITSVPCFEFWLLLHFEDTTRPYNVKGNKSAGDQLESELKIYIPDYHKGDKAIFDKTKHKLGEASQRAKKINKSQEQAGTDNPSTKMVELVEYLQGIKR